MDILSSLIFPDNFSTRPVYNKILKKAVCPQGVLRLFCKQEEIDLLFYLLLDFKKSSQPVPEDLLSSIHSSIEDHKLFRFVSKKKVFIQVKELTPAKQGISPALQPGPYLLMPFETGEKNSVISGLVLIPPAVMEHFYTLLGLESFQKRTLFLPENLEVIKKKIYQRIASPPDNLASLFITLPAPDLQLVLNRILHLQIANIDMLATYIKLLDDKQDILLDNLSSQVRQQVFAKLRSQRLFSTSRWTKQVKYIINRNIFKAAGELGIKNSPLTALLNLRLQYLLFQVQRELEHQSLVSWLGILEQEEKMQEFILSCPRRILTGALSYLSVPGTAEFEKVSAFFSHYISRDGLRLLEEDIKSAASGILLSKEERILMVLQCYRVIKDLYYQPRVEKMVDQGHFEEECRNMLAGKEDSYALDFIVDQIGFAKVVYALKKSDPDWLDRILHGVLKTLYEDTVKGKIRFIKYGDYKSRECQIDFLKNLLILTDQHII